MNRAMSIVLLAVACVEDQKEEVELPSEAMGRLKIEEVFYAGSVPTAGIERYYSDQFIQLRNVSDQTIDIGGMALGDVHGIAGEINVGSSPDSFADDAEHIYFSNLWAIPKSSPFRYIEPNGCIKIAQDAADHGPYSELSHFDAHFETFVEESEQDHDDPIVENLESVFYTAGYDWLITVFGPTIVLITEESLSSAETVDIGWTELLKVPSSGIIDSMEALMDENSGGFKRLHEDLDSGFIHVSGTYTGESVRRISVDGELQDNDNSGTDFIVSAPLSDCSTDE